MKPFLLNPIKDYTIWGTNHISKARGINKNYGTWWEVSAHPYGSNTIKNIEGNPTLLEIIKKNPDEILGKGYGLHETLRLAYLDTKDALSIQVHPQDEYALQHSNDYGKYESWYVLDAKKGATLVAGTNCTDKNTIKESIKSGTLEKYLIKYPVKKGDYITIPAGMLHALGKDILALEIGTNSNTTYRFYDYGRTGTDGKTRMLHLKESFDVVDFHLKPTFVLAKNKTRRIGDCPMFTVDEIYARTDMTIQCKDSYFILSNIDKDCLIKWQDEEILLPTYDSVFVPYSSKQITILKGGHLLCSMPKKQF